MQETDGRIKKMSYNKGTDLKPIQKDVLSTDVASNYTIEDIYRLQTKETTILQAINELNAKIDTVMTQMGYSSAETRKAHSTVQNYSDTVDDLVSRTDERKRKNEILLGKITNNKNLLDSINQQVNDLKSKDETDSATLTDISGRLQNVEGTSSENDTSITSIMNDINALKISKRNSTDKIVKDDLSDDIKKVINRPEIDTSLYALKTDITGIYKFKGSVNTYSELPYDAENGDVYNVVQADENHNIFAGTNVAYSSALKTWDALGGFVDLSKITDRLDRIENQLATSVVTSVTGKDNVLSVTKGNSSKTNITIDNVQHASKADTAESIPESSGTGNIYIDYI